MIKIVRKFSFCFLHFQWWFECLGKVLILFKNVTPIKKLPISDSESILQSILDLNWIWEILFKQNRWIWSFNATDMLYIFLKHYRNALIIYKLTKTKVWGRLGGVTIKTLFAQTILGNIFRKKMRNPVKMDRARKVL